ncbi:MAG: DUF817 family protein [Opitutales bacterium]|nr:DUF817 family protein [Opitutales bacterium]
MLGRSFDPPRGNCFRDHSTKLTIAENIATYANIWIYPNQSEAWRIVPTSKLMAWFLLMILSFVLVSIVQRPTSNQSQARNRH